MSEGEVREWRITLGLTLSMQSRICPLGRDQLRDPPWRNLTSIPSLTLIIRQYLLLGGVRKAFNRTPEIQSFGICWHMWGDKKRKTKLPDTQNVSPVKRSHTRGSELRWDQWGKWGTYPWHKKGMPKKLSNLINNILVQYLWNSKLCEKIHNKQNLKFLNNDRDGITDFSFCLRFQNSSALHS